ncbi:hypothetical protein SPRG_06871 [Saprolegnia parasitica CBS 223.65]|uniref:Metallo-beta-lactamase domain-containing protein n=1 Tax=Saprolegnia parasitica (strain CBS 223.65) TaxID=695850 RepID=A0A067CAT2_SAPPC|nr:hypothetical protein SPRG_06871 [Saprolegnia parasitica CBS 223.65]KDO27603.1 hypothetical protein SPRG_06871 [Saprolegnia parasitica CBS 223.65]|eukprot:XP_012201725.1 hypothetical protein SPRG_06871 [Saprolegnia parasitica CBS 223.65]
MDITFLGTASAQPSPTRNHSSLAFRPDGSDVWLFDCGEGTQHQMINLMADHATLALAAPGNASAVVNAPRLARISRIFLTHLHGDHCFGLPGLLCTAGSVVSSDVLPKTNPIHIYGPRGLKAYVRSMLLHTMSRIGTGFVLHELLLANDTPSANGDRHIDEVLGDDFVAMSTTLGPNKDDIATAYWTLQTGSATAFEILAAPIPHTVPTVGYLLREPALPGRLNIELVAPILQRNKAALQLKNPLALLPKLKNGETLTMPDGTVLSPETCVGPTRPGRVVVILGDTSDALASAFVPLTARDPYVDVVVHEATNACLPSDVAAGASPTDVEAQTKSHGHSTPEMAGAFANAIRCKRLLLNHFSSRYKGDGADDSIAVMDTIKALAATAFGSENVVCARDFMQVAIAPRPV